MSVTYVRYGSSEHTVFDAVAPDHRVVLYDPLLEVGSPNLAARLASLRYDDRHSDALIIRASRPTTLEEISAAVAGLAVPRTWALLRTNDPLGLTSLSPEAQHSPLTLHELRAVELGTLLRVSGGIQTEPNHHYVLPSGVHTDSFISIAALLRRYAYLQRIADYAEEYVEPPTVLVTDTGTLLPLLLELQSRTLLRYGYRPELHVFPAYPDTVLTVQETIRGIQARTDARILFVLSVSSSGKLARWVRAAAPTAQVLTLCDTAATPAADALIHIPTTHVVHNNPRECRVRRTGIHSSTLERIYEARWETVPLDRKLAKRHAAFWTIAGQAQAVQLHVNRPYWADPTGVRHHAVFLDIAKLLAHPTFRGQCIKTLRALAPRPDLLVLPTHDSTHAAIADLINEALGMLPTVRSHGTSLGPEAEALIWNAHSILIADDAAVTGVTIAGLRRAIYGVLQRGGKHNVKVFGFVAVERHATKLDRTNTMNPYVAGADFRSGATIYLPLPGKETCPWCREQRLLTLFVEYLDGGARDYADERLEKLSGRLEPPVAFGSERQLDPDAVLLESYFGELKHPEAVAAVTNVILHMQADHLVDEGLKLRVFRASSGLAFYDAVIAGTIFRTLHPRDVHWSGETAAVARALGQIDPQSIRPGYYAEIGLAALDGKLPRPPVEAALSRITGDPAVEVIKQIFGHRPE